MIQYNPKNWFGHITKFHKSDTLRILLPEMSIMAIIVAVLAYIELNFLPHIELFKNTTAIHSLIGFVIS